MDDVGKNVANIVGALILVILFGTLSYHIVEGWGLFESLYMTVITITTTGYGELFEMSTKGRIISMILMFFGIGIFFYAMNALMPIIVERRLKMRETKKLEKMENHIIVCGFGNMGKEIAAELPKDRVVIVDINAERVNSARESGYLSILGDAAEEEILIKANIKKAKALIACMTDASNAFTIMAAKDLNPRIFTFVVLKNPESEKKLKRVNVDVILSPYKDTAKKVVATLQKPATVEFIESIIGRKGGSLTLEKVRVAIDNVSLEDLDLRKKTGCIIVAIERNGQLIMPTPETILKKGDLAYVLGSNENLKRAESLLGVESY